MDENNLSQDDWLAQLLSDADTDLPADAAEDRNVPQAQFSEDEIDLASIIEEFSSRSAEPVEETPPPAEPEPFMEEDYRQSFAQGETLDQIFSKESEPSLDASAAEEAPKEVPPVEKGRPKRKPGSGLFGLPHLAATAILMVLCITIGVFLGRVLWLVGAEVLAFGREPITAEITIDKDDTLDDIANKLEDAKLIKYPELFKLYAKITDAQEKIKPGTYPFVAINEDNETIVYDYMALVSVLSPSSNRLVVVEDLRIPEGYTCAQIFQLLEEKNVCTVAEMERYVASINPEPAEGEEPNPLLNYWFLEGVQWGDKYSLEGYLFPDTYDFYENDDPERVLKKMLDAFDVAFTDIMRDQLEKVDGYTFRELLIIASMIEKESASTSESYVISSVIFNRLKNSANYPYLNIDATIVYALGGKTELTREDLEIDHPYNTYKYKGLPPGPISNPSQNSIAAALTPEETVDSNGKSVKYYYYALDPKTNRHHFSKTLKEHEAFLESLKEAE